jgi:hypothetical protein
MARVKEETLLDHFIERERKEVWIMKDCDSRRY